MGVKSYRRDASWEDHYWIGYDEDLIIVMVTGAGARRDRRWWWVGEVLEEGLHGGDGGGEGGRYR